MFFCIRGGGKRVVNPAVRRKFNPLSDQNRTHPIPLRPPPTRVTRQLGDGKCVSGNTPKGYAGSSVATSSPDLMC